jgi:hypothetical protein
LLTTAAHADEREDKLTAGAGVFIQQLVDGQFEAAVSTFDSTMTSVVPAAQLQTIWEQVQAQAGAYQLQMGSRVEKAGPYTAILVTTMFEHTPLDVKVVYDLEDKIAGLFFVPTAAGQWDPPAYADETGIVTEEVTLGEEDWKLPGTLYLPKGAEAVAGVVLVHGSGPQDRDETIGPNKPFRDLALGLAGKGIAVLTYDKRTFAHASKLTDLSGFTVYHETVDDAAAAARLLRDHEATDPDRIVVLGHSLGATMAPAIAEQANFLAGIIMMAGTPRPIEDLILEQMQYLDSLQEAKGHLGQYDFEMLERQVRLVKSAQLEKSTPTSDLPLNIPAAWWLSLRNYEADRLARELGLPTLILHGMRDYQVTNFDLKMWQMKLGNVEHVTIKTYDNLNHLFMAGEGRSTPEEYEAAGHVDEQVVNDIAAWVVSL